MRKSFVLKLHIGFWVCYYLFLVLQFLSTYKFDLSNANFWSFALSNIFTVSQHTIIPVTFSFYMFYFIIFPKYVRKKKIVTSIGVGAIILSASTCIGLFILFYLVPLAVRIQHPKVDFNYYLRFISYSLFTRTLIIGIFGLGMRGFLEWMNDLAHKKELSQKNHHMELALVKSQLDPHFLFNTINNIDVLILKDPNEASNYLNKLSDIMRFMLFETKSEEIELIKELDYIEKYLELQKIRTSNSNFVNFKLNGDTAGKKIIPMLFIPFIENAFKHTTNKKIDGAIDVTINITHTSITFKCKNKFDSNKTIKHENGGLGNELITKRLNLIYPNNSNLEISQENGVYSVNLIITND